MNVCHTSGNYGMPFKMGCGVTKGNPLSAKLFNVMVDAVAREWLQILREESELEGEDLDEMMDALFTIFYVDNAYIAAWDPLFLQQAIDGFVSTFERVGLKTNITKTKAMICTPSKVQLQLLADLYRQMRPGARQPLSGTLTLLPAESGERTCGLALSAATLQISMRSTSGRWWPKCYLTGVRVFGELHGRCLGGVCAVVVPVLGFCIPVVSKLVLRCTAT